MYSLLINWYLNFNFIMLFTRFSADRIHFCHYQCWSGSPHTWLLPYSSRYIKTYLLEWPCKNASWIISLPFINPSSGLPLTWNKNPSFFLSIVRPSDWSLPFPLFLPLLDPATLHLICVKLINLSLFMYCSLCPSLSVSFPFHCL